jgi:hypothetical protein
MSESDPNPRPEPESGDPGGPSTSARTPGLASCGGFVLGIIAAFVITMSAMSSGTNGLPAAIVTVIVVGLVGIGILVNERKHDSGSGALAGLAVGFIVFAGACGGILATFR